ncbi:MAG TPA: beta-ketoacyl-ACP synthase III [Actinomycetota bacterium]|nr:beta-ketoacyl-ACP synthase III [Actinomycetota bacterium]
MRVAITGLGKAVPSRVVTNAEIAPQVGVSTEWIEQRSGILERRYAADDESTSSLGTTAALDALHVAGLDPQNLSMVICATCTPDHLLPATASIIQDNIGAANAGAFDLGAACSGFVYAVSVGASLIGTGAASSVLVVGADILSRHVDRTDAMTAPLFGDAAAAVVLEADDSAEPIQFELGSDGSGLEQVYVPGGGSRLPAEGNRFDPACLNIKMQGREVFRNAVRVMSDLGARFGKDGFDLLVAHQANRRILAECAVQIGVDPEKVYMNIQRYGNTSAASIPLAMWDAWTEGKLDAGHRLVMVAFGAGYTWGAARMTWTLPSPAANSEVTEPSSELEPTLA